MKEYDKEIFKYLADNDFLDIEEGETTVSCSDELSCIDCDKKELCDIHYFETPFFNLSDSYVKKNYPELLI